MSVITRFRKVVTFRGKVSYLSNSTRYPHALSTCVIHIRYPHALPLLHTITIASNYLKGGPRGSPREKKLRAQRNRSNYLLIRLKIEASNVGSKSRLQTQARNLDSNLDSKSRLEIKA